ncbi:hypothetical protein F3K20_15060 [Streptomyces scabiei]|nr:hypothetical protein [Streptomyces sp. LBUM 1484]MBP5875758.1 hypothetical protein [Streptomyces sp. LBUM 1477]MBP5883478.1 hypothetical protein [Streptomyces sp. LBUM 1487]MBP5899507.1 hypothetical protein [Streptomyces sp. LBUM 1488]QTU46013.1 hypothetical protein F3K20_15060 [Streptomyces sp. LBUM 1482]QTU62000.1 hypothetical protein F3K22_14015 [Streptomyces sp. LBUM 1475]
MSEALRRIAEAVADATEDEVAAVLGSLGVVKARRAIPNLPRTPLPGPGGRPGIQSDVEWSDWSCGFS